MPIDASNFPALPQCLGKQWAVTDENQLAHMVALVLLGRARQAEQILSGAQRNQVVADDALKEQLRLQLFTTPGVRTYHRDGLLFEIISWVVARQNSGADEILSTPHLKSTQQGLDTIKVRFDQTNRRVTKVVIHEQKCTENPRDEFRDGVLPAFRDWKAHKRDNQLIQAVTGLLDRFHLAGDEYIRAYDELARNPPLAFQAALTVTPSPYPEPRCVALFDGYTTITPDLDDRFGDTFPQADIRQWFSTFALAVWREIEATIV